MHRSWGTLVAVVGVTVGFAGGVFYEQQGSLKATLPPTNMTTAYNSGWLKEQLVRDAISKFGADEKAICEEVKDAVSLPKMESDCYKITANKFSMQLKVWKRLGTTALPIVGSGDTGSSAEEWLANFIIKLADGDEPDESILTFDFAVDTWVYLDFDWDWSMQYYDSDCKLRTDRTKKSGTSILHMYNNGPNTELQMVEQDTLPSGFPTSEYVLVKCITFQPSDLPLTTGSLDKCPRCKKKVLPSTNNPESALPR